MLLRCLGYPVGKVYFGLKITRLSLALTSHWLGPASENLRESILWDTWSRSWWSSLKFFIVPIMWGIYNYTPETNRVSRVYSVAAFLQYVLHLMLFQMLHMFCTFTLVLSELRMCVMPNMDIFLFLYSFYFMLSWSVAKVFPKWSWDGSSCHYYYWYQFFFFTIIIIIKIADNITAFPLLELFPTGCSEVTLKC